MSRVEWGGAHDEATAAPVESEMSGEGLGQFLELGLKGYDLETDILSSGLAAVEVGGVAGLGDLSRVEWGHAHDEAAAAPDEYVCSGPRRGCYAACGWGTACDECRAVWWLVGQVQCED